ncbi:porin family protein [Octadecabacter sp.]|nr:porin family protein [Octadecabacter sp.]MDC1499690.1 porin family protein [Octadecabacter sp.]
MAPFAAKAGNLSEPISRSIVPTLAPTSTTTDWSGAYVGLSYGFASGDYSFSYIDRDMDDGSLTQLFGGYQVQRGALVYGGELAFGSAQDTVVTGFPTAQVTDMIDLNGRVGYASCDFLIYGVLGYTMSEYSDNTTISGGEWDIGGINYGIGVDYAISDNFVIGAEYLIRDLSGDNPGGTNSATIDFDTISVREIYKF